MDIKALEKEVYDIMVKLNFKPVKLTDSECAEIVYRVANIVRGKRKRPLTGIMKRHKETGKTYIGIKPDDVNGLKWIDLKRMSALIHELTHAHQPPILSYDYSGDLVPYKGKGDDYYYTLAELQARIVPAYWLAKLEGEFIWANQIEKRIIKAKEVNDLRRAEKSIMFTKNITREELETIHKTLDGAEDTVSYYKMVDWYAYTLHYNKIVGPSSKIRWINKLQLIDYARYQLTLKRYSEIK